MKINKLKDIFLKICKYQCWGHSFPLPFI